MTKRSQLIAIVLVFTVLSIGLVLTSAYFIKGKIAESLIEEERKNNLALTQQTASLLEKEVRTIQEKVSLLAEFPEVQDGDSEMCNQKLAAVASYLAPQIDNITRFNTDFTLDCAINLASLGYTLTPDSPITAVINDPEHRPYLSYSGYSPISQQEVLYLNLPVYTADDTYAGIIGGVIYLNYIADKYLTNLNLGEEGSVVLIDDNGNFLYHPTKEYIGKNMDSPELAAVLSTSPALPALWTTLFEETSQNRSGTLRFSSGTEEMLAVYAPANVFENRTWALVVTVPIATILSDLEKNQAFGGLNLSLFLTSAVILGPILFAALVLYVVISGLFNPLIKIRDFTHKIGHGNFAQEIDPKLLAAANEFGQLARALQKMALSLQESYGGLENKVQERTVALDKKVKELKRLNSLMVGRELKMAELKKEMTDLKKKP